MTRMTRPTRLPDRLLPTEPAWNKASHAELAVSGDHRQPTGLRPGEASALHDTSELTEADLALAPPADYGATAGGDPLWHDDGDYWVPPALRPHYAASSPTDQELQTYWHGGCSRAVTVHVQDERRGIEYDADTLEDVVPGPDSWGPWLHGVRFQHALSRWRNARAHAARAAATPRCGCCGQPTRSGISAGRVAVCPRCRPVVAAAVERARLDRTAAVELEPGVTLGDRATQVAQRIIGQG